MTKRELIKQAKETCNKSKHNLIDILNKLENIGAIKEAEKLEKIIGKLEAWQNS